MADPELLKWIEIDRSAISSNMDWVRSRLNGARLMAVVKADGYGHGALEVARLAEKKGASIGVLNVEEAVELRRGGVRAPILVMSPPLPSQVAAVARLRLEATVDSASIARALDAAARRVGRLIDAHLDVDYGLRRWGVQPSGAVRLAASIGSLKGLRLAGISTHIDYLPGKNAVEAESKLRAFHRLALGIKRRRPALRLHAANSSIWLDFPHWELDMARIGNLLYGINRSAKEAPLQNPWKFYARIVAINKVARGAAVGYGSEYIAPRPMTVATLPVGYADGLTLEPASRFIGLGSGFAYYGMLRGKPTPFIGRCSISHVLVDISNVRAAIGDAVALPIRRTAASPRIPRLYK